MYDFTSPLCYKCQTNAIMPYMQTDMLNFSAEFWTQLGSVQTALTKIIKGLKHPIKRIGGLDRGDILPGQTLTLCNVWIRGYFN